MRADALFHQPWGAMAFPVAPGTLSLLLKAAKGEVARCRVAYGDRYDQEPPSLLKPMRLAATDEVYDYFRVEIHLPTRRFRYAFWLEPARGGSSHGVWYGEHGLGQTLADAGPFQVPYTADGDLAAFPEWVADAVFYQVFPDRFWNGDPTNDPPDAAPWDKVPTWRTRYGGDLAGIREKVSYLADLGVAALYTTPIFQSPSPHRYDTTDYFQIDPHLGDVNELRALVQACHQNGIRLILDAVFNHSGDRFWAFQDVLERGSDSSCAPWYRIDGFPVDQRHPNYETFAIGIGTMPKLMTHLSDVRDYLLSVAKHWIQCAGIDGWRLDVANEVDHRFWRAFRDTVKREKAEAFIVGEAWHTAVPWLLGDQWDSTTNYPVRDACLEFFAHGKIGAGRFDAWLTRVREVYPEPVMHLLVNILGSHDTPRFLTLCGGRIERALLAATFQFTYIGAPMIYYGDEIGMEGEGDPDCRRPMEWAVSPLGEKIRQRYKRLISLRRRYKALCRGRFRTLVASDNESVYAYCRTWRDEVVTILINNGPEPRQVHLMWASLAGEGRGTAAESRLSAGDRHRGSGLGRTPSSQKESGSLESGPLGASAFVVEVPLPDLEADSFEPGASSPVSGERFHDIPGPWVELLGEAECAPVASDATAGVPPWRQAFLVHLPPFGSAVLATTTSRGDASVSASP